MTSIWEFIGAFFLSFVVFIPYRLLHVLLAWDRLRLYDEKQLVQNELLKERVFKIGAISGQVIAVLYYALLVFFGLLIHNMFSSTFLLSLYIYIGELNVYSMWPEILSLIIAIVSGLSVAGFTHYFAQRRENLSRKRKLIGWLVWLSSHLDQLEKSALEPDIKLKWWTDQVLQYAGDTFDLLTKDEYRELMALLSHARTNGVTSLIGNTTRLDPKKLASMRKMTRDLINQLSKRYKDLVTDQCASLPTRDT